MSAPFCSDHPPHHMSCYCYCERPRVTGRVLVCGQGDMGQLGLWNDSCKFERKRPTLVEKVLNVADVPAGGMHNLLLTLEGHVYSFGCNDEEALGHDSSEFVPDALDLPNKVLKISAGDSHSTCLLEDGRVFAWGSFPDSYGNMGLMLEGNMRLPIDVLLGTICCNMASGADCLVIFVADFEKEIFTPFNCLFYAPACSDPIYPRFSYV
uniref:Regulator of chromosome condensation 1 n=1 Tax=Glossina austeni TaxID=7395 RepID=A0A1A9UWS9_GLOAU